MCSLMRWQSNKLDKIKGNDYGLNELDGMGDRFQGRNKGGNEGGNEGGN